MTDDRYQGYRGPALEVLKRENVAVWDRIVVRTGDAEIEGILLPRSAGDDSHLVLKMITGYNIGVRHDNVLSIEQVGSKKANYKIPEKEFPFDESKPNVTILGTGGTIASRLDYRTGAVIPAFTPGELFGAVPELADIANIKTKKLFGVFSENMGPHQWKVLAKNIKKEIEEGVAGIVIGHGTDTMHYTAATLSFMVQNSPVPIVCVGSQRSSDRPSSDAARTLIGSVTTAAYSDAAEVMVSMFGTTSDKFCYLHRGTRVRKMHSSYRNTFKTLGDVPLGMVQDGKFRYFKDDYKRRRSDREVDIYPFFEERVAVLYYYPNMHPDILESMIDRGYKGIVIAGTGLGHVNKPLYDPIQRAHEEGIHMFMSVQTLYGYTQMFVYDTGRDLMARGVTPLDNMLPEVAYCKLGWVLGQVQEPEAVRKMMTTPIAHEITPREPYDGFVQGQGGLDVVEDFLKDFS
ncbi:Glu-tRNA(Gln) amidotransferase GatDE subunit D [Thermoplasmatales archaeon ex4484_6]|nr:MAG: Glu-tRNA(Gln) amidotransferase GatDE subunit D [Thermoplasmatales archaeon ex4484_6]RLF69236.1 MAG: Glu-tRNA(Gln) amidotransferase GatDE subunit D [Thermoplasmata archaeon]